MISYIIALIAALIIFANPLSQFFFPGPYTSSLGLSPRPKLNESLLAIDAPDAPAPKCQPDTYIARVLRREPLVIYLENFINLDERKHLLDISNPIFEPSTITHDPSTASRNTNVRDSSVALIPRTNPVRCIERRAQGLQGWRRDVWLERLRTQKYDAPSGHYNHHFDWSMNAGGWGRVSSFMVWVDDDEGSVEGGGTEFPLLEGRFGEGGSEEWCHFVECGEGHGKGNGTIFKVLPGNAVYWENFTPNGRGYEETWHAGLPVTKGTKVGLNIWSFGRIE